MGTCTFFNLWESSLFHLTDWASGKVHPISIGWSAPELVWTVWPLYNGQKPTM
jgi:hypothetical protein